MKNKLKVVYKCKPKYKKIKYFKLPLIDDNEDIEIKYDIDTINIHSSKIISKENIFMGLILFSGVFFLMY